MEIQLDIIDLLFLFSAGLGLFTALALISQKNGEWNGRLILSIILLLLTGILTGYLFERMGLYEFDILSFLTLQAIFISLGPFLLHYIKHRLAIKDNKALVAHLVFPISIFALVFILQLTNTSHELLSLIKRLNAKLVFFIFSLSFFHMALYCYWSYGFIHREWNKAYQKKALRFTTKIKWLKRLIKIFFTLCLFIGLYYLALLTGIYYSYSQGMEWFILLSTALCIQTISLHAIWYPDALFDQKKWSTPSVKKAHAMKREQVEGYMEQEQPYKVSGLKLSDLASSLQSSKHELSQFLNEEMGMTFFDFINYYRIKEAQKLLTEFPERTILRTAYEVGFNSKTTFNRAFKKHTLMTPREFREKNKRSTL